MVWPGGRARKPWLARFARERKNLSASVEETLAVHAVQDNLYIDELEDYEGYGGEEEGQDARKEGVIPPRLSLQSRQMSAVQRTAPQSPNAGAPRRDRLPTTAPVEVPQEKRQLAGRTTKVRLQAVRSQQMPAIHPLQEDGGSGQHEKSARGKNGEDGADGRDSKNRQGRKDKDHGVPLTHDISQERLVVAVGEAIASTGGLEDLKTSALLKVGRLPELAGSGMFEQGQSDVSVANEAISERSVVMVTLTGNPGPVVVQYISLQPQIGFTIHLSAPTTGRTPFNYVIWPGNPA